ncbi:MAG: SLC13 family permease, partial [Clostridia bacterium]|nr:SLC13 family permease [Clostridia bacterium]
IVLQTIAANIGSSLTPVGNPQNLYLFSHYNIPLGTFLLILLPVVLGGALLLALSTLLIDKKPINSLIATSGPKLMGLESDSPESFKSEENIIDRACLEERENMLQIPIKKGRLLTFIFLFFVSVLAVLNLIPIEGVAVFLVLCVLVVDRRLFREVDYGLLFTFIGFFIFVGNMSSLEAVKTFLSQLLSKGVFIVSLLTSQFISNVPAAVLLSGFTKDAKGLLLGVNVGGMGTLIASLASVISYKLYTKAHPKMTKCYLKVFTGLNLAFLAVLSLVALFFY